MEKKRGRAELKEAFKVPIFSMMDMQRLSRDTMRNGREQRKMAALKAPTVALLRLGYTDQ